MSAPSLVLCSGGLDSTTIATELVAEDEHVELCGDEGPRLRLEDIWAWINVRPAMDPMRIVDEAWPLLRRLMGGHTVVYRATGGRIGHKFPGSPPMLLLDHVGAKSARERTTPLVYIKDGEDLVLVASKGGNPKNPAWFHNLRANPETTVQVGAEKRQVRAHVADETERARLWPKAVETYRGYRDYQERTEREIPLVILERR